MNKTWNAAWVAGWAVVGLALAGCSEGVQTADGTRVPADATQQAALRAARVDLPAMGPAPEWRLRRLDGTELTSDELKGKVVVVDFWATWCPPCREEIPGYIAMQRKYEEQGLVIVGVSLDRQGPPVVERFAQQFGINYPLVMGDDAVVQAFGGIEGIPTTFLIDRDGQIRHRKVGAMHQEEYEPLVTSLL